MPLDEWVNSKSSMGMHGRRRRPEILLMPAACCMSLIALGFGILRRYVPPSPNVVQTKRLVRQHKPLAQCVPEKVRALAVWSCRVSRSRCVFSTLPKLARATHVKIHTQAPPNPTLILNGLSTRPYASKGVLLLVARDSARMRLDIDLAFSIVSRRLCSLSLSSLDMSSI